MNLEKLLSFEQGRLKFFETLTKHPENWQQNPTPLSIVRKMLDKTFLDDKKILILFNIEFLQVLVEERKINPKNIYYIADNDLEYLSGIKIFKVQSYKLSDFTVPALKKLVTGIDMKFDLVFSNPPYNGNIDIKILNEIIDVADEFVVVHPSTWILDTKEKAKLFSNFKNATDKKYKSLYFFNGNFVFNIDIFTPCVITHIDKNHNGEIDVNYFDESYTTESIFDVTKFSDKWIPLVREFKNKISQYINDNNGNMWERFKDNKTNNWSEQPNKVLFQLPMGRGGTYTNTTAKILRDDFYTFYSKEISEITNKNCCDKVAFTGGTYYYFNSEIERNNFLQYLKSDFVRFCLSLSKLNKHYDRGEMELIPWLDFTEEWDDEKLFKEFDVSQELQDYIREFIPDYYGIRK